MGLDPQGLMFNFFIAYATRILSTPYLTLPKHNGPQDLWIRTQQERKHYTGTQSFIYTLSYSLDRTSVQTSQLII